MVKLRSSPEDCQKVSDNLKRASKLPQHTQENEERRQCEKKINGSRLLLFKESEREVAF